MTDLFNLPSMRVEQPRKVVQTQTRYDVVDDQGTLLAYVTDQQVRSRREAVRAALPQTVRSTHATLVLTDAEEVPRFVIDKVDAWNTHVHLAVPGEEGEAVMRGDRIGTVRANSTRRQYFLLDADENELAQAVGDLRLRSFPVTDNERRRFAGINKKWAGLRAELFTTADRYAIELTEEVSEALRVLVVVTAIVLDMMAYESKELV
ncbi:phospholipid scramblase-related protein [Actinomadura oligospora]|uniref:phospholipid scramblase-related protein n=1 Tax=Actinomadura oligospora TaxID=111804 RepID=UPI00047D8B69|nr:phospholipid scramblase-related protein [Actinomadura oligospora]